MSHWMFFLIGSLLLTLVLAGGFLLSSRKDRVNGESQKTTQGARLLILSLWLASLSMMAYIAFVFGKR